jgi:hypothetical protein
VHVTKSVGKPDAGNPHVRFDERGTETGLLLNEPQLRRSSTLPIWRFTGNENGSRGIFDGSRSSRIRQFGASFLLRKINKEPSDGAI